MVRADEARVANCDAAVAARTGAGKARETPRAPSSVVVHSFPLKVGRATIARSGLEESTLLFSKRRDTLTSHRPLPAQARTADVPRVADGDTHALAPPALRRLVLDGALLHVFDAAKPLAALRTLDLRGAELEDVLVRDAAGAAAVVVAPARGDALLVDGAGRGFPGLRGRLRAAAV